MNKKLENLSEKIISTINEIETELIETREKLESRLVPLKEKLFSEYDKDENLKEVIRKMENFDGVGFQYCDSGSGDIYAISYLPNCSKYLYLPEYLEQYCLHFDSANSAVTSYLGPCVLIFNLGHVYCYESGKRIIDREKSGLDTVYTLAKIALHQNKVGIFSHVFQDNYGHLIEVSFEPLLKHVKNLDDIAGLEKIVNKYEDETYQTLTKLVK